MQLVEIRPSGISWIAREQTGNIGQAASWF